MASRPERIASVIKKVIIEAITFKLRDPHLGFVTVTDVEVSGDFSVAKVYVSFLIEEDKIPGMKVLDKARGLIRSEIAHSLDLRRCPEVRFFLDDGYEKEMALEAALERAKKKNETK